jgi:Rrf2 family iron-sulfur cluster assembly transcriptional regulator
MRLTTKGRFAVSAILDLAMHQQEGPVTLAGISERQHISLSYLEQLFGKLRRHNLVTSVRGPGGGYCLGRESADITVSDIIRAVDEVLGCDEANCREEYVCITHKLWSKLTNHMYEYLDSVSLADLVKEQYPDAVAVLHDQRPARRPAKRSEVMAAA